MKAKISNIETTPITMKDGTVKDKFTIHFEEDPKAYEAWSCHYKVGDEVEGEVSKREWNDKTFYSIKFPSSKGGGFQSRGKTPEELKQQLKSFSSAYAKDVTVAFINQGTIKDSKAADASILHYSNLFSGIIGG